MNLAQPIVSPLVSGQRPATGALRGEEPSSRLADITGLGIILGQILLLVLAMRSVGLETLGFRRVIYIAALGFVVHHLLPLRHRLPFFALLSIAGMTIVLGGTIEDRTPDLARGLLRTGTIVGCGAILIGICHLPLGYWIRAGLLALAGGLLALLRTELWPTGLLAIAWPILGSMFMFRAIVYLYDLATSPKRPSVSQSASYFFLLPNSSSLLFPVVDFRTMCQKYYDEPAFIIYQRGVSWMARGVIHLLLYRLIDRLLSIEAANVQNGTQLVQFIVSNMFLYLKVSGTFHLIAGTLLLFGFNLPETNRRYFLASSFNDYWRRVNIYWRNFIMKVFYYPAFFRFKHLGQSKALVVATAWAFFVTWALHLYQTWWIRGSVSWSWPDAIFWSALGLLVLANSLWELRRTPTRSLGGHKITLGSALSLSAKTAATFAVISILWSLWSTPTLQQWIAMWSYADLQTLLWSAAALTVIALAAIAFEVVPKLRSRPASTSRQPYVFSGGFRLDVARAALPLLVISGATHPAVQARWSSSQSPNLVEAAAVATILLEKDSAARGQGRGYYESLTSIDQGGSQFFETMNPGQGLRYLQPTREVPGVHFLELTPNSTFEHHGWRFTTNRWGMRDRDYEKAKPPHTRRLAFLGSSHVMGYGLADAEMFEPAIERKLNSNNEGKNAIESLNFSIGGLSPLGQIWLLQDRVGSFSPDLVIFVGHLNDFEWTNRDVGRVVRKRLPLPAGFPADLLARARVGSDTLEPFVLQRLRSVEEPILRFCYDEIVRHSRGFGATPVYVFLPLPTEVPLDKKLVERQLRMAGDAGFVVIDLSDVYEGRDAETFAQKDQGSHLNKEGAAIVAAALHARLIAEPRLGLSFETVGATR